MNHTALLLAAMSCTANGAPTALHATGSERSAAVCNQLGIVAYWAATAHIAEADNKQLLKEVADAGRPNRVRPAIPPKQIEAARWVGVSSHGNAGLGLTSLEAARAGAIASALHVYHTCLGGGHNDERASTWSQVARSVEATVFHDRKSVRRGSNGATLWTLTNFASPEVLDGKTYRSAKTQFEYDCTGERYRVLATIFYDGLDGNGKVTSSTSQTEPWNPVAPHTMAHQLLKLACAS